MTKDSLLTQSEMKDIYGEFFNASPGVPFEVADVPEGLQALIPYAQFWGVSDDWQREEIVSKASAAVKENLKTVVCLWDDKLDAWLAGGESTSRKPSDAYIAFSAMRLAADFA